MNRDSANHGRSAGPRRAFSIVEAMFSIILVGGLLVVALDTVGASSVAQRNLERRTIAQMLAFELMSEVIEQDYEDPDETPSFGVEPSEITSTRLRFDDLDDYAGWSESPPQAKDGAVQSEYHDWRRNVLVQRVNPNNYDLVALSDTGLRKINVAVAFNNERLISLTAVRWGTSENDSVMLVSIE